jgi:hypothetical protein
VDERILAHPSTEQKRLAKLKERYRHELMDDDERLQLRDALEGLCIMAGRVGLEPLLLPWWCEGPRRGGARPDR